ncbi:hypothetical protein [Gluconobacter albidus]|uniref:hypothetical protein n=1 Tax=Gluconobacter albidus TaxID=318683 RepID=UPI0011AF28E0|nr:hypothetical protein [Gluconobacter albidus]MBS1028337.1 hypothetical protein [Gluconobacter albidus]MCP1274727.1 hypothetical protein [Gluconobacter albidus]
MIEPALISDQVVGAMIGCRIQNRLTDESGFAAKERDSGLIGLFFQPSVFSFGQFIQCVDHQSFEHQHRGKQEKPWI